MGKQNVQAKEVYFFQVTIKVTWLRGTRPGTVSSVRTTRKTLSLIRDALVNCTLTSVMHSYISLPSAGNVFVGVGSYLLLNTVFHWLYSVVVPIVFCADSIVIFVRSIVLSWPILKPVQ